MRLIRSVFFVVTCAVASLALADGAADPKFVSLYEREWAWRLNEEPMLGSSFGKREQDGKLSHVDAKTQARRLVDLEAFRKELGTIEPKDLSAAQRTNYAIFKAQLDDRIDGIKLREYLIPMTSDSSFYADLPMMAEWQTFATKADYESYISRLGEVPRLFDEHTANLKEGVRIGMTLPQVVLQGRDAPIRGVAELEDVTQSPFYKPFKQFPPSIGADDAKKLAADGEKVIRTAVVPAYAKLLKFFTEQYVPKARKTLGAYSLPNGKDYYRLQIRTYTTLDLAPEEIHKIGLAEVARIRAEMEQVKADAKFDGDFAAFLHFLRTDPQFYAKTPRELLATASYYAKRIDGMLPKYFGKLPRLPYGIAPVPDAIAPYYTTGRYAGPPEGSTNAGFYWVNTWKLEARPLYALPALTLHEAVPGHHLQGALASEQGDQPPFRRSSYISAFGEGWALYAEHLGVEMGVYETPYDHFGRLTYEMWRACRLVIDTGVHAMGWTREQSLALLRDNTALSEHEITTEVDRYISWPGQALSYKLGELKIRELRAKAEKAMGEKFDLRAFHDAVLSLGSVPLPLLEARIDDFIAGK